jgi:2-amino-4-hydroxy-6-hydroxymethyldihydropteridine diphosphokinase
VRAAVGLGSNLGDRRATLHDAVAGLRDLGTLEAVSSLWETAPVGGPPQDAFLNAVVVLRTVIGPRPLLDGCLALERAAGRERRERWGPRTLDLDLLLYGDAEIDVPGLRVPHPGIPHRRFVLAPLAEAWPGALVPGAGMVEDLLAAVGDQDAVVVAGAGWEG